MNAYRPAWLAASQSRRRPSALLEFSRRLFPRARACVPARADDADHRDEAQAKYRADVKEALSREFG